jgi:hypothetical protein
MIKLNERYSRSTIALFWTLIVGVLIGVFIYYEQIAILYVVATLSLVALLLIVAFADLENVGRESMEAERVGK